MRTYIFEINTPLNFKVHTTIEYWGNLMVKHPELDGRLDDIINTLKNPTEIRKSRRDEFIFVFYSKDSKNWLCAIIKKSGIDGFLVTAYITDRIKEGEILWQK